MEETPPSSIDREEDTDYGYMLLPQHSLEHSLEAAFILCIECGEL